MKVYILTYLHEQHANCYTFVLSAKQNYHECHYLGVWISEGLE